MRYLYRSFFFFSSRRRHTRSTRDWSSDVCSSDLPHKTVFGAWSVRARVGAQVSTPLFWDEIDEIHPDELTISTLPGRIEAHGDPWADMNDHPQSLEPLLAMYAHDRANGLMDAPW